MSTAGLIEHMPTKSGKRPHFISFKPWNHMERTVIIDESDRTTVSYSLTYDELQIDDFTTNYKQWIERELESSYNASVDWFDGGLKIAAKTDYDLLKCFTFIGFAYGQAYNGR